MADRYQGLLGGLGGIGAAQGQALGGIHRSQDRALGQAFVSQALIDHEYDIAVKRLASFEERKLKPQTIREELQSEIDGWLEDIN